MKRRTFNARWGLFVERAGKPAPTRVVYAAPGTPVPPGVIVRPLDEHPAIIEDRAAARYEAAERMKRDRENKAEAAQRERAAAELEQRIVDYLTICDCGTVETLALVTGKSTSLVYAVLHESPKFRVIGQVRSDGKLRGLWAITEEKEPA